MTRMVVLQYVQEGSVVGTCRMSLGLGYSVTGWVYDRVVNGWVVLWSGYG